LFFVGENKKKPEKKKRKGATRKWLNEKKSLLRLARTKRGKKKRTLQGKKKDRFLGS